MEITSKEDFQVREWTTKDGHLTPWIREQFERFHNEYKLVHVVAYTNAADKACLAHYFQKI